MQLHHCSRYTPLKELCQPHQFGRIDKLRKRVSDWLTHLITTVFVEQPLASPGSAKNIKQTNMNLEIWRLSLNESVTRVLGAVHIWCKPSRGGGGGWDQPNSDLFWQGRGSGVRPISYLWLTREEGGGSAPFHFWLTLYVNSTLVEQPRLHTVS